MPKITFFDFFAGIGGFRLGMERAGFNCVGGLEIDPHACEVYKNNFGDNISGDITKIKIDELPDFDILCAGFPCQAFSISGKMRGFYDATRGTLFFDIIRILDGKKPSAFILENVQNLEKHDKGKTLKIMIDSLSELGYTVNFKVLNAKDFGVPQNRERIIIVGSLKSKIFDFSSLRLDPITSMKKFLDSNSDFEFLNKEDYTIIDNPKRQPKSGLIFTGYRNKAQRSKGTRANTPHLSRVHKQPNRIYSADGIHPTIASQEQSGRYFIYTDNKVRKLTLNECFKFMGFSEKYKKTGSKSKLYERIGNSICINMIEEVGKKMMKQFFQSEKKDKTPREVLEEIYLELLNSKEFQPKLPGKIKYLIDSISKNEQSNKGVYTVTLTSLFYKFLHPEQDIRLHQANMLNGYSGRSFDTHTVTPFLKSKHFYGAMKESGWLTRSLEQNIPYNLDYPGKINNSVLKRAFLELLDAISTQKIDSLECLKLLLHNSIKLKQQNQIALTSPIVKENTLDIIEIIDILKQHFYHKYKGRGASILPVIAVYSIYECIMSEFERFKDKRLLPLASHTSSDKSSGLLGDINLIDQASKKVYEAVEIKFEITITDEILYDVYKKIQNSSVQRYYILSTKPFFMTPEIKEEIEHINKTHGCEIIINGVLDSIKYYLRLLKNTNIFIKTYMSNLEANEELPFEHKLTWNTITKKE